MIAQLKQEGTPVVGMNWWPLYDSMMWDYRDNTKTVMECIQPGGWGWNNGLYTIKEHPDGKLVRVRTGAVDAYRKIIAKTKFGD